jgi:hypothetical protein
MVQSLSDLVSILWASLQILGLLSDTIWRKASALGILLVILVILVNSMKYHLNDCESNHRIRLGVLESLSYKFKMSHPGDHVTWKCATCRCALPSFLPL